MDAETHFYIIPDLSKTFIDLHRTGDVMEQEVFMTFKFLGELDEKEVGNFKGRFLHTNNITLAYWQFEPGDVFPKHSHPHEQISCILKGEFEYCIDGETKVLGSGGIALILPYATHYGKAITKCELLDVFYPVRDEYR